MSGIIDSHTHRYPPEVFADSVAWAEVRGERYWASLTGPGSLQGWASRSEMLAAMDKAGIEKAVLLGWYWEHQDTCDEQNQWHARWVREDPDRFIAFATLQPREGQRALDALKRAVDEGWCKGVGELLPKVQGFDFRDPAWEAICSFCQEAGLPINLHATEPVGHPYVGRIETPLMDYVRLAERFPELKLILAHWGGGLPFYELNRWCRRILKNVYYDTAASPLLYDRKVWQTVLSLVEPHKVLFGSDYPLKIYPRTPDPHGLTTLVAEVREAGLPDVVVERILQGNVRQMLG